MSAPEIPNFFAPLWRSTACFAAKGIVTPEA